MLGIVVNMVNVQSTGFPLRFAAKAAGIVVALSYLCTQLGAKLRRIAHIKALATAMHDLRDTYRAIYSPTTAIDEAGSFGYWSSTTSTGDRDGVVVAVRAAAADSVLTSPLASAFLAAKLVRHLLDVVSLSLKGRTALLARQYLAIVRLKATPMVGQITPGATPSATRVERPTATASTRNKQRINHVAILAFRRANSNTSFAPLWKGVR